MQEDVGGREDDGAQFASPQSDSPQGSDSDLTGTASVGAQSFYFPSEDEPEPSEEHNPDTDVTDATDVELTTKSVPSEGDANPALNANEESAVSAKGVEARINKPDPSVPAAEDTFPHGGIPAAPRISNNGTASRSGSIATQPPIFVFSHADMSVARMPSPLAPIAPPAALPATLPVAPAADTHSEEVFFAAAQSANWPVFMRCLYEVSTLVSAVDAEGRTALHLVCDQDCQLQPTACAIVEILLELKADPNRRDCRRLTPLMLACIKQSWDIVLLLLAAGGDLNILCRMVPEVEHCLRSLPMFDASLLEEGRFAASDLVPVDIAPLIFAAIDRPQSTFCRDDHIRCMRCFRMFTQQEFPFYVYEKHDCANCRRIVCEYCMDSSASYAKCICSVLRDKSQSGIGTLCKSCYSP
jgi:hypothetical protein